MKAFSADQLYGLLPAIYRIRDAERGGPLRALLAVVAGQASLVEQDIARLYENWFIETCDEALVPYIGDLLSVRGLHQVDGAKFSHRARVANTIGFRRRKGTASMLEQLARDTTGWPARVVECFQLLATTQYMAHLRPQNVRTPDLRQAGQLELLDCPFDTIARVADVRHVDVNRGRHNVMNVAMFLWRLQAFPVDGAVPFAHGDGRFSFSQLGQDAPLFNRPVTEIDPSHLAEEVNVPAPIRRRALAETPQLYVGPDFSVHVTVNGAAKPLVACNLTGWTRRPEPGSVAVDPVLGRLSFPAGERHAAGDVRVRYHYGFSGELGGGCYERATAIPPDYTVGESKPLTSLRQAVAAWENGGPRNAVIEIADNGVYEEAIALRIPHGQTLIIRAANRCRPTIRLRAPLVVSGGAAADGERGAGLALDGLLVTGDRLIVEEGNLGALDIVHCTLVPGWSLDAAGRPAAPDEASLVVNGNPALTVSITRSISGRLRAGSVRAAVITDSVIDGIAGPAIEASTLRIDASSIIGPVSVGTLAESSNSLFTGTVVAERKQEGCVRFSCLPLDSRVPRRFQCQPNLAIDRAIEAAGASGASLLPVERKAIRDRIALIVRPQFTDRRYGRPGYAQLSLQCAEEIRAGADDQGEMGAFHHLRQPQREANLRASIDEYLRVGLEAGLFYVT